MFDVAALGELLIDFTPSGFSQAGNVLFERNPGGAPANVLACLSKFGKSVSFLGMVGKDEFGKYLKNVLIDAGIDVSGLKNTNKANTTLAFVHLSPNGDRSFSFYRNPGADAMIRSEDLDYQVINNTKIFHFGSISMTHKEARIATLKAAESARRNGNLISFDPNFRAPLWEGPEKAKEVILIGMELADVVKVSEEELTFLTDTEDLIEGSYKLVEKYGVRLIFVTIDAKGSFFRYGEIAGCLPTYDVKTIDTTGAGDAFFAGILYKIIERGVSVDGISEEEMQSMVDFANAAGALSTTKKGAIPSMPSIDEVYSCMCNAKKLK